MKRFSVLIVALTLGVMLMQCGGGKDEQPTLKTIAPAQKSSTTTQTENVASPAIEYDLANGEAVYKKFCFACHDGGLAGAAKHSDQARWAESAAKGTPELIKHVMEGYQGKYGMLPPKGTCMECSEQDIIDAVHYQLKMGGSLK